MSNIVTFPVKNFPIVPDILPPVPFYEEKPVEWLSLDDYVTAPNSDTIYVRLRGDSFANLNIHSGDLLVVDKSDKGKNGELVLVNSGNKYIVTIKDSKTIGIVGVVDFVVQKMRGAR